MLLLLWCLRRREQVTHDVASQSKRSGRMVLLLLLHDLLGMVLLGCVLLRVCVGESRVEHAAHGVRCCLGLGLLVSMAFRHMRMEKVGSEGSER